MEENKAEGVGGGLLVGQPGIGCGQGKEWDEMDVYLLRDYVGAYAPTCQYDDDFFAQSSKQIQRSKSFTSTFESFACSNFFGSTVYLTS